ncbi:6679_t:CDS:2 [Gigaspora margarita]|uniref:6679_t:CDS:1 n=1 Tax=Gigaspora margarita TaxID=4874 RepID=A0ABM8W5D1_GIGMA|nr:6679_t:CDS:2 [Gigaspora margarita]
MTWKEQYQNKGARENWEEFVEPITVEETMRIIAHAPLNKATRPSMISNEILKRLLSPSRLWTLKTSLERLKKKKDATDKVRLQHYKLNVNLGQLTPCKVCEILAVNWKTKNCFIERDSSKLWVVQVDCKNRIHGRVECFGKTNIWIAESKGKKCSTNIIDPEEDWYWQMYNKNNSNSDEYIVLFPKHNDQSDMLRITIVEKIIGTRHICNKSWPFKKKLMITTLLLIITIARYKLVINVKTNCPKLVQMMEQNRKIPNYLAESRTRQELGVYLASLNTAKILKCIQLHFTIIENEDRSHQQEIQLLCLEFVPHKFNYEHPQICLNGQYNS